MATVEKTPSNLPEPLRLIVEARHHDPFEVLGRHALEDGRAVVRVFLPQAERVRLNGGQLELDRVPGTDLFVWEGDAELVAGHYLIDWYDKQGQVHTQYDPYLFGPQLSDFDLHLFGEGRHWHAYRFLGAHQRRLEGTGERGEDGIEGFAFAVWAPSAARVSVIGEFNDWDGRVHPMRVRPGTGVWELFIPGLAPDQLYKFEIRDQAGLPLVKIDPYGNAFQKRPETAAILQGPSAFQWRDAQWLEQRAKRNWQEQPLSVYEVHLGSWQRAEDGGFLNYRDLAERLGDYCATMGFTHIELMPVTEHPLDASWGYQATGYFAPTARFGTPDDFRFFVDHLHERGIGVLLDWVPAHFPRDTTALGRFDGTALFEHADPRQGEHRDWGTYIFNFGRHEVKNFLLSSALYWLDEYHIDGLRVDAVASMLYLDYSRKEGEWIPNKYGGNENLDAIEFLRQLNTVTHEQHPGTLMIAEESTSWPQVSRPTYLGGLGFSMKWNMGWMHDTLSYMEKDPIYRHYHHDLLTFGLLYAFTENFVLPFSHDEVVHGKRSMIDKMPGDAWQKFASLRLLYTFMYAYPGKKLLFQGCEFAQGQEWNFDEALDWYLLERQPHLGIKQIVADLNRLYQDLPALHQVDFDSSGFEWIDCHDSSQSVLSFVRKSKDQKQIVAAAFNFTPVPRENYRIGVSRAGFYREAINSDGAFYGGSNVGNQGGVHSEALSWMGREHSIPIALPPLAGVIMVLEPDESLAADEPAIGKAAVRPEGDPQMDQASGPNSDQARDQASETTSALAPGADAPNSAEPSQAPSGVVADSETQRPG
ncbi:1,4-alpha-glucan branching protein GlgB [Thiorhodovibrio frisius]|uniref:1,4-alpha-glucan branching enzyme GlgB n=1 Tax=Thiorhodovibrio frisius TaxID=631362 RepID=H8Z2U8_9GAMM|nr:1,4-alpha-glucan branching protein GlgB [Thiorhodovibrio frisius]EIC21684.1 alpha-1,4-glucan:alpha-1,4-glucan 6-glycosyltransferase [Thiorhodovibrio frisius]WPL21652.1 1,4-alpha-glucan branching enzyme GlgB [Thiorhodovibrio frisius]